jgi:hypothetical protein
MLFFPLHLAPKLRMSGALPPFLLYDFMACTGITIPCNFVSYSLQFLFSLLFTVIRNFVPPIALYWNTVSLRRFAQCVGYCTSNVIIIRTALYTVRDTFLYKNGQDTLVKTKWLFIETQVAFFFKLLYANFGVKRLVCFPHNWEIPGYSHNPDFIYRCFQLR